MKKGPVSLAVFASVCCFIITLFPGCGSDKGVAAKVDGKRIYIKEVEEMITRYASISKKLNPAYTEPTGLLRENIRKQFLDGLIDKTIILKKAGELKVSVTDEDLTAKIKELKNTNGILDEASFNNYLKEQGITEKQFRDNIRDIMLMEKTRDKYFADIVVSDSESMAYYNANAAKYARETIRAAHILIKTDSAKAEAASKEAKAGKDFTALAKKYSDDAMAKTGGDLGVVNRGDMLPEIDQVLFSLKKDSVVGPIKTSVGYHILKALSDIKKEVRPFDDVKSEITSNLVLEKRQIRLKSLRDNVKIKVLWDYKSI